MNLKHVFYLFCLVLLTACASNSQPVIDYYTIEFLPPGLNSAADARYGFVKVDQPHLSTRHTTEAIIYSDKPYHQDIYIQSQWKEPLPVQLQEWLVQSLDHMGLFTGVMRVSSRAKVPLLLESDIVSFEHLVYRNEIHVSIHMTLLEYGSRKIIKHRVFEYRNPVPEAAAGPAVVAFNQALEQFYNDLYQWLQD